MWLNYWEVICRSAHQFLKKINIKTTHVRTELMRHAEYDHVRPLSRLPQLGHRPHVRGQLDAWQVLDVLVTGVDDLAQL